MKKIQIKIPTLVILVFYINTYCISQERDSFSFSIGELVCPNNLIQNANFNEGINGNVSNSSVPHWKSAYKDPKYSKEQSHYDNKGVISMWGNQVVGEALYQKLAKPLTVGKRYRIAFSVQARKVIKRPDYARIKIRVSSKIPENPKCSSEDCFIIGISKDVKVGDGWVRIELPEWTATKDVSYLIISPENEFRVNDCDKTSAVWIDNICLEEIIESKLDFPAKLIIPYDNEIVNAKLEKTLDFVWKGSIENVSYRFNIYEISKEDSLMPNLEIKEPVFTKQVKGKNTFSLKLNQEWLKNNQSYIWNVQAINNLNEPSCPEGCNSIPSTFRVLGVDCGLDIYDIQIDCNPIPYQNGQVKYNGSVSFKNTSSSSSLSFNNSVSGLFLYNNSANPTLISGLTLTSNFPSSLSPNATATIYFELTVPLSLSAVNIQIAADDAYPSELRECIAIENVTKVLPYCICDDCDTEVNIRGAQRIFNFISTPSPDYDYLNIKSGLMSSTPVTRMQAEIVYFSLNHSDDQCETCVKNNRAFATFDNQNIIKNHSSNPNVTSQFTDINGKFMGSFNPSISKMLQWETLSTAGVDINNGPINFDLIVAIPKMNTLKCCTTSMKICIRYILLDKDCRVCDILLCSSREFNNNGGGNTGSNNSGSGGQTN